MDIRFKQQSIFDGRDNVIDTFQLITNSSSLEIWGIEVHGMILYFIDHPSRNHMGFVIGVLPDTMQQLTQNISELSQGYFKIFSEQCPLYAQYMQDGFDRRFDRTAILNVEGKWQFWKSMTYHKIDETFVEIISDIGFEFCESITQLTKEITSWSGFSKSDDLRAGVKDFFNGYKIYRKFASIVDVIDNL